MAKTSQKVQTSYIDKLNKNFLKEQYVTATSGVVGVGQFYSEIENRAPMIDLSKDLGVRLGVNRIQAQEAIQIQGESGPNGEIVYGLANDKYGQVRILSAVNIVNNIGSRIQISGSGSFAEITFYGTGLNGLFINGIGGNCDVSIDGALDSTVNIGGNTILTSRNYSPNQITNLVSGLPLGLHTVKITSNVNNLDLSGFEILNERTDLLVPEGDYYVDGKLIRHTSEEALAYDSGFTNEYGTAGTKGGHVSVYMDKNGQIKKDIQWVDVIPQYLDATDHSNEEIITKHNFREFGSARGDDFSTLSTSNTNRAFTLDDGVTTLVGNSVLTVNINDTEGVDISTSGDFLTITFVGTGLDIVAVHNATGTEPNPPTVYVDGVSVGQLSNTGLGAGVVKKDSICSGLPYGTHTVKVTQDGANLTQWSRYYQDFIIYGPKKPSIEESSEEIASYYLMSDFAQAGSQSSLHLSQGVITKTVTRETLYTGGSYTLSLNTGRPNGWIMSNGASSSTVKYSFFGTGIVVRMGTDPSGNSTLTLDGSTDTSSFDTFVIGGQTYNTSTGVITGGSGSNSSVGISGLELGYHEIEFTNNNGINLEYHGIEIITPIHSPKLNGPFVKTNALRVGSTAIGDLRKLESQNENSVVNCYPASTSNFAITNETPKGEPVLDLAAAIDIKKDNAFLEINFYMQISAANANQAGVAVVVDGKVLNLNNSTLTTYTQTFLNPDNMSRTIRIPISKGVHFVQVFADAASAGGTLSISNRNMFLKEV